MIEAHPDFQKVVRAVDAMTPSGKAGLAMMGFCHAQIGGCVLNPEVRMELEKLWALMVEPSKVSQN